MIYDRFTDDFLSQALQLQLGPSPVLSCPARSHRFDGHLPGCQPVTVNWTKFSNLGLYFQLDSCLDSQHRICPKWGDFNHHHPSLTLSTAYRQSGRENHMQIQTMCTLSCQCSTNVIVCMGNPCARLTAIHICCVDIYDVTCSMTATLDLMAGRDHILSVSTQCTATIYNCVILLLLQLHGVTIVHTVAPIFPIHTSTLLTAYGQTLKDAKEEFFTAYHIACQLQKDLLNSMKWPTRPRPSPITRSTTSKDPSD